MKKGLFIAWAIVVVNSGLSCTREVPVGESVPGGNSAVLFSVSSRPMNGNTITKGVPYGLEDYLTDIPFGVTAYTSPASSSLLELYMQPTKVEYDADKKQWVPERTVS